jgi:hypothetical protein
MKKPEIVVPNYGGRHNESPASISRLLKGNTYKNLSTICIRPTRGVIPAKVVQAWENMMSPMNQKFLKVFMFNMEVGDAYNAAVEMILANPDLSKWPYILTLEEDNMPPPDGLLKLYESMEKFDVVSGLYWTKGEAGQPMIYGNPLEMPKNFIPQIPQQETVQACNGLGMGFTLFKTKIFHKVPKPWFRTLQLFQQNVGTKVFTQDLYFFENAAKYGFRFACDTRIKVGHYDYENDMIW